jgi:uncharacterized protein YcnI
MTSSSRVRRWRRLLTVFALSVVALVAGAGVASAHVTVNPSDASAGAYTTLTFKVPNESATAGTVGITVSLPAEHPFASVAVKAVPGWTVKPAKTTLPAPVTADDVTIKEAVTSVTWTADKGVAIQPGEFAEFELSVGPVPAAEQLTFPTTQTYGDGIVVQWNEPTPASGAEPEHPVPTLTVNAAAGGEDGHSHGGDDSAASVSEAAVATTGAASTSDDNGPATVLAAVSLVVAAASLVVAALALRRRPTGAGR